MSDREWPAEVDLWRREGGSPVQALPSLVGGRHNGETCRYVPSQPVQGLVEAIEETFCDDAPCSRCAHLRKALADYKNNTEEA